MKLVILSEVIRSFMRVTESKDPKTAGTDSTVRTFSTGESAKPLPPQSHLLRHNLRQILLH